MATGLPTVPTTFTDDKTPRITGAGDTANMVHIDQVYSALMASTLEMEKRVDESLKNYNEHPDVQANLQQLQYDLQSWNLALTTMTNIQKNMMDALSSIASNFR